MAEVRDRNTLLTVVPGFIDGSRSLFKVRQQRGLALKALSKAASAVTFDGRDPRGGRHALSSTGRRRVARPLASRCHACARQAFTNDAVEVKGGHLSGAGEHIERKTQKCRRVRICALYEKAPPKKICHRF